MQKRDLLRILFSLLLFQLFWGENLPAYGGTDPSRMGLAARVIALGRATTAMGDDANTLFTNPAGVALLDELHLTSMNTRLIGDVNYNMIGGTTRTGLGPIGLGYIGTSIGDIPVTTLDNTGAVVASGTTNFNASTILFSYAKPFAEIKWIPSLLDEWYMGASLKYFTQGFNGGGVQNGSAQGYDLDFGLLYPHTPTTTLGLVAKNILPSSMGGALKWGTGKKEGIPAKIQVGLSTLVLGGDKKNTTQGVWRVNLDTEFSPSGGNQPLLWHVGTEFSPGFAPALALRAGLDQNATASGSGSVAVATEWAAGLGLKMGGITFDYAYHQLSDLGAASSHFFSIGYQPEQPREEPVALTPLPEAPKEETRKEYRILKPVTFSDVTETHWARAEIEALATMGMVQGFPDGTFRPDRPITRAELSALLAKSKGLEPPKKFISKFPDVKKNHWATPYISMAAEMGWIQGYAEDKTFRPMKNVTRAELATILARFDQIATSNLLRESPFYDLPLNHWSTKAVAAAKQAGLLRFLEGKAFQESRPATRAETIVMISRTSFTKEKAGAFLKRLQEEGYVIERKKKKPVNLLNYPSDLQ